VDAALSSPPSLLALNLPKALRLAVQGTALARCDALAPIWAPWPDKPLIDVLNIQPPETVAHIRDSLGRVGLRLRAPPDERAE
jgi:hypothetical protein